MPKNAKLRLDANGGLSLSEAEEWLKICDLVGIEFLEQPLSIDRFSEMLKLNELYSTSIALDESVTNFQQLVTCYQQGWTGIFVIKLGIAGYPDRILEFIKTNQLDVVFSSVLETEVGRNAVFKLVEKYNLNKRPMGFGINLF